MAAATKQTPADGPTTTLTVPAKPALTTAANLATLAGSAMVVAGPPGWIAAGAVAAGSAAVGVSRSVARRRSKRAAAGGTIPTVPIAGASRRSSASGGRRSIGGSASVGGGRRGGSLFSGGRAASGRSATGRASAGRAGTGRGGVGAASGGGRTGGSRGGILGRLGKSARGTSGGGGRSRLFGGRSGTGGRAGATGGAGRSAGSRTRPTSGSRLRRAASAVGRTAGAVRAGTRAATPGAAATEARRHANRPTPTGRGRRRRALGAAGLAAGAVGVRNGYRKLRRWTRRRVLGHTDPQPPKTEQVKPAKPQPKHAPTGAKVRRPVNPTPNSTDSSTGEEQTMAGNTANKTPQPVGPVYQAARRVHATAVEYTVKGAMELRTEAYEFPYTIAELAAAIRARANHCTKEPIAPEYAAALNHIASTVEAAAQAARNLGPSFDALHPEVKRHLQPRVNEQKWDTTANRP